MCNIQKYVWDLADKSKKKKLWRISFVSGKNEFFEMLQDYRPAVLVGTDQRSPGPSEYLRGKVDSEDQHDGNSHGGNYPQSPKLRSKLTRFWSNNGNIPNGKYFLFFAKFINRCYHFTSFRTINLAYRESIFNLVYTTWAHRVILKKYRCYWRKYRRRTKQF